MKRKYLVLLFVVLLLLMCSGCAESQSTTNTTAESQTTKSISANNPTTAKATEPQPTVSENTELLTTEPLTTEQQTTEPSTTIPETTVPEPPAEIAGEPAPNITFDYCGNVKNDKTGKWRLSKVNSALDVTEYALYYYKNYFKSDDEIHAIINYSNDTTIRIRTISALGLLDVTTLTHIQGEENNADILFGGDVINSYMINIKSGELVDPEE